MARFDSFTPPTLGSELTAAEITMLEEITALANSSSGQFIRKESGSLVNSTLSETIALSGLSDVAVSSPVSGHVLSYNGSSWVNSSLSETISLSELDDVTLSGLGINNLLSWNGSAWVNIASVGTVTSVSVVTANGVSGTVATATITPAITLTLGDITPSSVVSTGVVRASGNDGAALGVSGTAWADLFLASGAVINFDAGNFTITHSAGTLTVNGAVAGVTTLTATTLAGTLSTAAQGNVTSLGTLTTLTVDDITINGNTISSAGASSLAITPTAGQAILLDATISVDAGVVTGATSITSTTFVGALTGNATTATDTAAKTGTGSTYATDTSPTFVTPLLGTPTSGTLTNCTGLPVAGIAASTVTALGVGSIELGHATDTTIARVSAGVASIEGSNILVSGGALGTPSSGTGTNITGIPAANILAGSFGAGAYVISTSLQAATIELGHATDTTLSRVSAGVVAIEGVNILTTAGGTLTGNITLGEGADPATIGIVMDASMSADERYSGITVPGTAGATIAFGDICYLDVTATEWLLADASAATTSGSVVLGICVDASIDGAATSMLLVGTVRSAAFPASIALGAPVYVSETAGDITATQPVTTDAVIRVCGWAVTAEPNTIYFNPSSDYITHT